MIRRRRRTQPARGVAAVETALTMPLLVTTLLGLVEMGRALQVQQILGNAAREGGRQAATGLMTNAQVVQVVLGYLTSSGLSSKAVADAVVTVSDLTKPGTDASQAAPLDQIQVIVQVPFGDVRILSTGVVLSGTSTLTGEADWPSQKDQPYAAPPTPPLE